MEQGIDFGTALRELKGGKKLSRKNWNGKGQYLLYVCESVSAEEIGRFCPGATKILPWIGIRTVDGSFVPWLASQTDLLSEDWYILEGETE